MKNNTDTQSDERRTGLGVKAMKQNAHVRRQMENRNKEDRQRGNIRENNLFRILNPSSLKNKRGINQAKTL